MEEVLEAEGEIEDLDRVEVGRVEVIGAMVGEIILKEGLDNKTEEQEIEIDLIKVDLVLEIQEEGLVREEKVIILGVGN